MHDASIMCCRVVPLARSYKTSVSGRAIFLLPFFYGQTSRAGIHKGFTLVELVVVLVLVGIMGVFVMPRFIGPSTFEIAAAQDGMITTIRAAQQAALGRDSVTFEINSDSENWIFVAKTPTVDLRTFEAPLTNVKLETGSSYAPPSLGDTCASGTQFDTAVVSTGPTKFKLAFDSKGNLASFTNGVLSQAVVASYNGVRICVNDAVELSVCVSPAGYAYAGSCDE